MSGLPQLLPQLEGILFPIMQRMVSTEGQDVFEDVLEIVAYFTFFSPEVPSRVFSLIVLLRGCRWEAHMVTCDCACMAVSALLQYLLSTFTAIVVLGWLLTCLQPLHGADIMSLS